MQLRATDIANATAWAAILVLIAFAFVLVHLLGPFGLILLGLGILFVCTSISLREDNPTWGAEVFRAQQAKPNAPEHRAAQIEERTLSRAPLRFYRWCGMALLVAGITGFLWQLRQ